MVVCEYQLFFGFFLLSCLLMGSGMVFYGAKRIMDHVIFQPAYPALMRLAFLFFTPDLIPFNLGTLLAIYLLRYRRSK